MSAVVMDGKALAAEIKQALRKRCAALSRPPRLAVVLVGDDPASAVYVRNKEQDCAQCGISCADHRLPSGTSQAELLALIDTLNRDEAVDGILVQMPLPAHLDAGQVGLLHLGQPRYLPCTPAGILALLKRYGIDPAGKHCVVVGRSNIVGKPMAALLLQADATVTVCHSKTPDLCSQCLQADILVSAAGRRGLITADMVKPGAVVIDVAMNRGPDGKLCGDADYAAVAERASFITPVPGGVGPMTRAMLLENTYRAALLRENP